MTVTQRERKRPRVSETISDQDRDIGDRETLRGTGKTAPETPNTGTHRSQELHLILTLSSVTHDVEARGAGAKVEE